MGTWEQSSAVSITGGANTLTISTVCDNSSNMGAVWYCDNYRRCCDNQPSQLSVTIMVTQKYFGAVTILGGGDNNQLSQSSVTTMRIWEQSCAMTITRGADNKLSQMP
eukprot:4966912-Ditylum_brightwellii.AAC.1